MSSGTAEQYIFVLTVINTLDIFVKGKGMEEIEKKKSLFDYVNEFSAFVDRLEKEGESEELIEDLTKFDLERAEKLDGCAFYIKEHIPNEIQAFKNIINHARAKIEVLERAKKRFVNDYLDYAMTAMKIEKHNGAYSIYKRKSESVEVTGRPEELPEEYREMQVDYKPNKKKIKEALKDGKDVPGAKLITKEGWTVR